MEFVGINEQHAEDVTAAHRNKKEDKGTQWISYGDGATWTAEDKAGWGICMEKVDQTVNRRVQPPEYCKEVKGRVVGEQRNDTAEAQAILEALLRVHPGDAILIPVSYTHLTLPTILLV